VGVPCLVIAHIPAVHADPWASPDSADPGLGQDPETSQPGDLANSAQVEQPASPPVAADQATSQTQVAIQQLQQQLAATQTPPGTPLFLASATPTDSGAPAPPGPVSQVIPELDRMIRWDTPDPQPTRNRDGNSDGDGQQGSRSTSGGSGQDARQAATTLPPAADEPPTLPAGSAGHSLLLDPSQPDHQQFFTGPEPAPIRPAPDALEPAPSQPRWRTPASVRGWLDLSLVGTVMASPADDDDATRLQAREDGFPRVHGLRIRPGTSPLLGVLGPDDDQGAGMASALAGWTEENWPYLLAGAAGVGAGAILLSSSGPVLLLGAAGGALANFALTTAEQKLATGDVDWGKVTISSGIGASSGLLGVGVGFVSGRLVPYLSEGLLGNIPPLVRGAAFGGGGWVVIGITDRALHGEDPFAPQAMAIDLFSGAIPGAIGGELGDNFPRTMRVVYDDLLGTGAGAFTSRFTGKITVSFVYLVREEERRHVIAHEAVHSLLHQVPFGLVTGPMYSVSHLWRFAEEAAAEAYALRSIRGGLAYPLRPLPPTHKGYGLSRWRIGAEAAGLTTAAGGAAPADGGRLPGSSQPRIDQDSSQSPE